jgi:hypothetical protein
MAETQPLAGRYRLTDEDLERVAAIALGHSPGYPVENVEGAMKTHILNAFKASLKDLEPDTARGEVKRMQKNLHTIPKEERRGCRTVRWWIWLAFVQTYYPKTKEQLDVMREAKQIKRKQELEAKVNADVQRLETDATKIGTTNGGGGKGKKRGKRGGGKNKRGGGQVKQDVAKLRTDEKKLHNVEKQLQNVDSVQHHNASAGGFVASSPFTGFRRPRVFF